MTKPSMFGLPASELELRNMTEKAEADEALRDSEHRFHALFNGSPIAMALSDERGLWVEANAAFGHLLGVDPSEMIGKAAQCYAHPDDHAQIAHSEQGQLDSPDGVHQLEIRFLRPDGETRWAWVTITPTPGPRGRIWTLAIAQDVTARKAAENALRESEADLAAIAAVARCVQDGEDPRPIVVRTVLELSRASTVCLFESSGPDTLVATAVEGADVLGFSISLSDPSMTAQVWRSGEAAFLADARDHPNVSRLLLALDNTVSVLWQPVIVHGKVEAVLNVTWRHRIDDPGERAVRAVKVIADEAGISLNAKRLHLELERFALTDPLTGSLNRRAWDVRIHEMIDQIGFGDDVGNPNAHGVENGSVTIALIDLDHFKTYNDTYGHAAGDVLLREFAEAASGCLRKTDVFARWGGEEFIIAMPDTKAAQAAEILDRVRACVPLGSTCSVGHTSWRPHETVSACIARADSALYEAKQAGRNCLAAR